MAMSVIWTGMVVVSVVWGLLAGNGPAVAAAAVERLGWWELTCRCLRALCAAA